MIEQGYFMAKLDLRRACRFFKALNIHILSKLDFLLEVKVLLKYFIALHNLFVV